MLAPLPLLGNRASEYRFEPYGSIEKLIRVWIKLVRGCDSGVGSFKVPQPVENHI